MEKKGSNVSGSSVCARSEIAESECALDSGVGLRRKHLLGAAHTFIIEWRFVRK
jgi:hypothetical protein